MAENEKLRQRNKILEKRLTTLKKKLEAKGCHICPRPDCDKAYEYVYKKNLEMTYVEWASDAILYFLLGKVGFLSKT